MLRLQLLGGFRAHTESADASTLANQPRRAALLAHLAVERDVPRERVIDLLWPDSPPERGRHSLNQGIYFLRRILGSDWVEMRGDRCVVAPWVSTDVEELEAAAAAGQHDRVLELYRGPLLAGTPLAATAEFDMWADGRRIAIDRLHRRARRHRIAALLEAHDRRGALECAAEWCRMDPLEDEAQHRYLELLAAAGQRTAALRQYQAYSRLLDEHELEPLEETRKLVEQLQHGTATSLPETPGGLSHTGWDDAPTGAAAPAYGQRPGLVPPPGTRATLASAQAPPAATPRTAGHDAALLPAAAPARGELFATRSGLLALLAGVFLFNLLETTVETWLAPQLPLVAEMRLQTARAAHWFEGHFTFDHHELTNRVAVIGYSVAYFIFFPAMLLGVGIALLRRAAVRPFRVFSFAIAINYLVSLPFFLFFPVVERWAFPESGAMVLSDLWTMHLIDVFRPISGLDNSFPSFHTSLTVLTVLCAFIFRLQHRWTVAFIGSAVILATFVLGIHWTMDLIAGAAAGVLSVALALTANRRIEARYAAANAGQLTADNRTRVAEQQLEPR
jgi:DNA-binding SARP family transcriptional activator/membrane-associated phospholipid phosphatase